MNERHVTQIKKAKQADNSIVERLNTGLFVATIAGWKGIWDGISTFFNFLFASYDILCAM